MISLSQEHVETLLCLPEAAPGNARLIWLGKVSRWCLLLACCAIVSAMTVEAQAEFPFQSAVPTTDSCSKDYPIPTTSVNHERALASETLIPDQISLNGKILRLGVTEEKLSRAIGANSVMIENPVERTDAQQCDYLLQLLRDHPNSMYLYRIKKMQLQHMSGIFRVTEWTLTGIGKLRAFLHSPSEGATGKSYLFLLTLNSTSIRDVKRQPGSDYVLVRPSAGQISWNVQTNSITISTSPKTR